VALAHELTKAHGGDGAEFSAAVETAERERNGERERGVRCQLGLHICDALVTWRHQQSMNATWWLGSKPAATTAPAL
jgi:hypothetical protein